MAGNAQLPSGLGTAIVHPNIITSLSALWEEDTLVTEALPNIEIGLRAFITSRDLCIYDRLFAPGLNGFEDPDALLGRRDFSFDAPYNDHLPDYQFLKCRGGSAPEFTLDSDSLIADRFERSLVSRLRDEMPVDLNMERRPRMA